MRRLFDAYETVVFYHYYSSEPFSNEEKCSSFDWSIEECLSQEFLNIDDKLETANDSYQNDKDNYTIDKKEDITLLDNPGTRATVR